MEEQAATITTNWSKDSLETLGQQLDDILENYDLTQAERSTRAVEFLKSQQQQSRDLVPAILQASLLSDRIFNCDFIMHLKFADAAWIVCELLPTVDPYARTQFVWQVLQCPNSVWNSRSKLVGTDVGRFKELCRNTLTYDDMNKHPYTGTATIWLKPFDSSFFDSDDISVASARIQDICFAKFGNYVQHSLWLNRIFQADFFSVSSLIKQMQMHANLEKVPLLTMLKFVAQILHSSLDPAIKLAFWKKVNTLDGFEDAKTLTSVDAVAWLVRRCNRCKPLFESMFQFPQLYDKIYELKFDDLSVPRSTLFPGFGAEDEEDEESESMAKKLIKKCSSFEEVAIQLLLSGEELKHEDIEFMLHKKKFSMVGECVKDNLEFALELLPLNELMFLVLKYVKNSLCLECLESFEKWKPGTISGMRDYYGNNALWYLAHRRVVAHPSESKKRGKKTTKQGQSFKEIYNVLVDKYGCDPESKNIYGLSYNMMTKIQESCQNSKEDNDI